MSKKAVRFKMGISILYSRYVSFIYSIIEVSNRRRQNESTPSIRERLGLLVMRSLSKKNEAVDHAVIEVFLEYNCLMQRLRF